MKYYLLVYGDKTSENALIAFDNPADRDTETILRIFGADLSTQDEAEQWGKMRAELNERGVLTFEGDPCIKWFTATPADAPLNIATQPTAPYAQPKGEAS